MGELIKLASDPVNAAIGGGALLVLILIIRSIVKRRSQPKSPMALIDPNVKRCLAAGNYDAAARLEKQAGNYAPALEYYLRAQKPAMAAQMAERLDRPRDAAELYEKAGDYKRAVKLYRSAGVNQRADELLAQHGDEAREVPAAAAAADAGDELSLDAGALLNPGDRARKLEQAFDEALAASGDDPEAAEKATELGRQAAEELLSLGETQRAAELLHKAGLTDQAINLYVNLLGDPAAAARLLAERGDHKRAAELYEIAGEQQRALAAWVDWCQQSDDPLQHIEQVARLGNEAVGEMLDSFVRQRPPATDSLELHYRIANALEQHQCYAAAMRALEGVTRVDPGFRDAKQKIATIRPHAARQEAELAKAPAPPKTGAESAADLPMPSLDLGASLEPPADLGASLEPPADLGASLEPPADLGASLEPPADLGTSLEPPADLGVSLEPPADLGAPLGLEQPETAPQGASEEPAVLPAAEPMSKLPSLSELPPPGGPAKPAEDTDDIAMAKTMFGAEPLDLPAPGDLPRTEAPQAKEQSPEPAVTPAAEPAATPPELAALTPGPSLALDRSPPGAQAQHLPALEPSPAPQALKPQPGATPLPAPPPQGPQVAAGKTILGQMTGQISEPAPAATGAPAPDGATQAGRPAMPAGIDVPSIQRIVSEAASAAARQAAQLVQGRSPSGLLPAVGGDPRPSTSSARRRASAPARGIERVSINLSYLADDAVRAAQLGPRPAELAAQIGERSPDLQNVELFYRKGLADLAVGKWSEAQVAFEAVEEASPGYRDAGKRVDEISHWKKAVTEARHDDRYRLLGELGRGGMAVVYRAHDEALDREVALKFLSEDSTQGSMMMQLFQREARAAAGLNHPNIVTVYDVGTIDGRAFLAMELVVGTTVEHLLEQGRMQVLDALRIADAILSALEYAHDKQIIHRDIKPSNMMRSELGVVKLMDFGLAKSIGGEEGHKTTMVAGTPQYMAPEQFAGKNVDESSDIFALGASLYEMLAGHPAFEGMRRDKAPVPLRQSNPTVPRLLEQLVHRSVELEQEKRYRKASEMAKPLRQILSAATAFVSKKQTTVGSPPSTSRGVPAVPSSPEASSPALLETALSSPAPVQARGATPTPEPEEQRPVSAPEVVERQVIVRKPPAAKPAPATPSTPAPAETPSSTSPGPSGTIIFGGLPDKDKAKLRSKK